MEASALRSAARVPVLAGLSPHLRLQSDERLVALVRAGHDGAFEALVRRYQPRLLAFCRHMLRSNEDAEDVLQEVFAAAYRAIRSDERPIKARPWLYRIARNRCLNHLRKPSDAGQESMDVFQREAGGTTADTVHRREEFRQIISDVQGLPEAQRSALLLREIEALSYDQIAEAMETTIPSVKSLLVRARMALAEAAEARHLTCAEVRLELSQAAEGITKVAAPTRRHVRTCTRCRTFKRELRRTTHALAAIYPIGPLLALKSMFGAKLGAGAGAGALGEGSAVGGGAAIMGGGGAGALSAAGGSVVAKAAAGLVAAALVTAGAVEVKRGGDDRDAAGSVASSPNGGQDGIAPAEVHPLPLVASEPASRRRASERPTSAGAAEPAPAPVEEAPAVEEPAEEPAATPPVEEETEVTDTAVVDSESAPTSESGTATIGTGTGSSGEGSEGSGGSGGTTPLPPPEGGGSLPPRLVDPLR